VVGLAIPHHGCDQFVGGFAWCAGAGIPFSIHSPKPESKLNPAYFGLGNERNRGHGDRSDSQTSCVGGNDISDFRLDHGTCRNIRFEKKIKVVNPCNIFPSASNIPSDYYTPLLSRTDKLIAIAESGFSSQAVGLAQGIPKDQVAYLNAIHSQLGPRLAFWVNTLLDDFNLDSYAEQMKKMDATHKMHCPLARLRILVFAIQMVPPNPRWKCGINGC
jgi:hypothetical protein